jgi:hypothetical protein
MDAADVLYGVSMGGDGVTKVVSRKLPREEEAEAADAGEGPRPFAGIAAGEQADGLPAVAAPAGSPTAGEAERAA